MPASITCLVISGCQVACSPISKNVAFTHSLASALSTAGVLPGPGAVVERQNDFLVAQEVILLEMLETEAGAAGCVDLHDAGKSQAAWLVAGCNGGGCGFVLSRCARRQRVRNNRRGCRRLRHGGWLCGMCCHTVSGQ